MLEQLAEIARASQAAHHELLRQSRDCRTRLDSLRVVTEQSRAALDPIAPAVNSLAEAAAARRANAPAIQAVVHVPGSGDKADRVARLSEQVMSLNPRRTSNYEN
jgi:hypothetical protein